MVDYITRHPDRAKVIGARVTLADCRLIEAAALSKRTTVSSFVAQAATTAARDELAASPAEGAHAG